MQSFRRFATFVVAVLLVAAVIAIGSRPGTASAAPPVPAPVSVVVTNTPLPVTGRIGEAPKESFDSRVQSSFSDGSNVASAVLATVPEGKQLVVTHISASANLAAGAKAGFRILKSAAPPFEETEAFYELAPVETGTQSGTIATQQMQIYLDAGEKLTAIVFRDSSSGGGAINASVSGYLLDVP